MDKNRLAKGVAVASGLCFLCVSPGLIRARTPGQVQQTPQVTSSSPQEKKDPRQTDLYEGLQFTDEQKAKIVEIHRDTKARMDAVAKDDKLNKDQKEAMLEGYRHLESGEIFKVLTHDQQQEVRKRLQQEKTKKKPTP